MEVLEEILLLEVTQTHLRRNKRLYKILLDKKKVLGLQMTLMLRKMLPLTIQTTNPKMSLPMTQTNWILNLVIRRKYQTQRVKAVILTISTPRIQILRKVTPIQIMLVQTRLHPIIKIKVNPRTQIMRALMKYALNIRTKVLNRQIQIMRALMR